MWWQSWRHNAYILQIKQMEGELVKMKKAQDEFLQLLKPWKKKIEEWKSNRFKFAISEIRNLNDSLDS